MSLDTFINQPCTIIQRTADTADAFGDLSKTETSTPSVCELQPTKEAEVEGGNIGITTYRLYLEGLVALNADDAVIVDSEMYELIGDAVPRRNSRTGIVEYTEAIVRRVRDE